MNRRQYVQIPRCLDGTSMRRVWHPVRLPPSRVALGGHEADPSYFRGITGNTTCDGYRAL